MTSARGFICPYCRKSFNNSLILTIHMAKNHSGGK